MLLPTKGVGSKKVVGGTTSGLHKKIYKISQSKQKAKETLHFILYIYSFIS